MTDRPHQAAAAERAPDGPIPRRSPAWRWLGWSLLMLVLGAGFLGYLRPELTLSWESLMALCGF